MMLRQRKGCYDPKDLEGVLPVLDRCLYDGGDGGIVLGTDLRAEASADLELGLRRTEGLLAVIVRRRDGRICQEGENVVPVLGDALFEFVQFGVGTVGLCIDRRPCAGIACEEAYWVLRRRHAAVRTGLDDWPTTGLKFHNTSLQLFDFLFLPCYAAVKDII